MTYEPFRWDALPRVPRAFAAASRQACARLAGLEREWTVDVPRLGRVTLALAGLAEPRAPCSSDAALMMVRGAERGRLIVDGWTALRAVAAAIGAGSPRALRALGPAERGVLAGQVAMASRSLAVGLAVSLDPAPGNAQPGWIAAEMHLRIADAFEGQLRLEAPVGWLPAPAPLSGVALNGTPECFGFSVTASAEIATTYLPRGEWAAAAAGDAVVFDGVAAAANGQPLPGHLRLGRYAAACLVRPDGSIEIQRPFMEVSPMSPPENVPTSATEVTATQILAAAPIIIVAELARLELSGADVLGLRPGIVLPLGRPLSSPVELRAGGLPWARGELVNAEGDLGVRITELVR